MSEIKLKTIRFEGLPGVYTIPDEEAIQELIDEAIEQHEYFIVSTTEPTNTNVLWLKPNV